MKLRETTECLNCKKLARRVAKIEEQMVPTVERIDKLELENLRLLNENEQLKQQLAAARKNSSTSSKPPSSDIVKPKKPRGKRERRWGHPFNVASFRAILADWWFSHSGMGGVSWRGRIGRKCLIRRRLR